MRRRRRTPDLGRPKKKPGNPNGQPTIRTPDRAKRLFAALRQGNSRRAAVAFAGFSHDALEDWMKAEPAFKAAVIKAEHDSERARVATIVRASRFNWTAAAWLLERRFPEDWAKRDKVEHTGAIQHELSPAARDFKAKLLTIAEQTEAAPAVPIFDHRPEWARQLPPASTNGQEPADP